MQAPTQLQPPTCAVRITLSHAEAYTTIRTTHVCSTNHPKSCRGIRTQLQPPTCAVQTTKAMQRHTHTIKATHMCSTNHMSHAEARMQLKPPKLRRGMRVGLARTIYIQCIYGIFGREITKYTIIYGAYIQFWPTLHVCSQCPPGFAEHVCTQATQVIRGARAKPKLEVLQRMCALKATQVIRGVCETRA